MWFAKANGAPQSSIEMVIMKIEEMEIMEMVVTNNDVERCSRI